MIELHTMQMPASIEELMEYGLARLQRNLEAGMDDLTKQAISVIRASTPKMSGETAKAWEREITPMGLGVLGRVLNTDPNASRLEFGTPAHIIRPRHAKVLVIKTSTMGSKYQHSVLTPQEMHRGNMARRAVNTRTPDVVRYKRKFKRVVGFAGLTDGGNPSWWFEGEHEARADGRLEGYILRRQVMHPGTPALAPVRNNIALIAKMLMETGNSIASATMSGWPYAASQERFRMGKIAKNLRKEAFRVQV